MVNPLSKKLTFSAHLPLALELTVLTVLGLLGWQLGQERLLLPWPGPAVWLTVGLVWLLPGFVLLRMVTPDTAWPWFGWLPLSFGLGLVWLMLPVGTVFYFNLNLDYLVWLVPRLNGLLLAAYVVLRLGGRLRWPGGCPPGPPEGGEGGQIPPSGGLGGANIPPSGGLGGADHPLLTRWLLVLGLAVQAVMLWVFWDAYGFTPGGDEWSYMQFIQRFLGAETVALRAEPAELYYFLLAFITRLSGAPLLDFYRLYLYQLLLIIASLGFLLLGQTLFQNRAITYLAFVVQGLYMLSDIHTDSNGVGLGLLTRLLEDKYTAWLLLLPLTQTFFLMFVRSGRGRFVVLFGLLAVVNVMVHPIAITWITLSVGAAGLLFAVFGPRRRMLLFIIPFLAVAGLIFFIGWWTQSLKLDTAFDTSITPEGLLTLSARRVFFFSVEENSYMGHPFLLSHPLVILALLATVWLLFRLRRSLPAQFLFSNIVVVLLLIFNPLTAPLIGQIVAFWQIYRIVWMLPVALTVGYALYEWAGMLSRWLAARRPFLANRAVWLKGGLLAAGLVVLAGLLANHFGASWRSLHVWNDVTVTAAERQLTEYIRVNLPDQSRVLAPSKLGTRLGAQIDHIQPVTFRSSNAALLADIDRFYTSRQLDQSALDLLQEFRAAFLIIERDRPLESQLRFMPGAFTLRYANPDYALYAWQPAQLSESERAIIEGHTRLGSGDLAAAEASYQQALSLEPDQPLALMGLSNVYQAQGQADQALALLQAAVDRSPDNPWLRLKLGQLLAQTAAEDADQLEQAAAAIAHAVALAPHDLAVVNAVAEGSSQLPPPARQLAAVQELQAIIIEFFQRRAAAEPDDFSRQYVLGYWYEQFVQPEAAIAQYQHMASIMPGHPEPYLQQARLFSLLNQPEQALAIYQEAIKHQTQPKSSYLYWLLAYFYLDQKQLTAAIDASQNAVQLADTTGNQQMLGLAHFQQAAIYEQQQQSDQVLYHLQLAVEAQPNSAEFQAKLAQYYQGQGQTELALDHYRTATQLAPHDADNFLAMGALLRNSGRIEAAQQALQKAFTLAPSDETYTQWGALIKADPNQAFAFPLDYIAPAPNASAAQAQLFLEAVALGLWSRDKLLDILAYQINTDSSPTTEALLQELIERQPDDADIRYYLGELYWQQDQIEGAQAAYKQALTVAPTFWPAALRLAQLDEQSDLAAAGLGYRRLFQLEPTNLVALQKMVHLSPPDEASVWRRVLAAQAAQISPTFSLSQTLANGWRLRGVQVDEARLVRGERIPLVLFWHGPNGAQPDSADAGWVDLGEGRWLQVIDQAQNILRNGSFELGIVDGSPAGYPNDIYAESPNPAVRQLQVISRQGVSTTVALLANTPVYTRSSFVSEPLPVAADKLYLQGGWLQTSAGGRAFIGRRWRGQLPEGTRPNSYLTVVTQGTAWQPYVGLAEPLPGSEQVEVWLLNQGGTGPVAFNNVFLVEIPPPDGS